MSGGATLFGDPQGSESVRFGGASWGSGPWGVQHVQQAPPQAGVPRGQLPPQFQGKPILDDLPAQGLTGAQKPAPQPRGFKVIKNPGSPPVFRLFGDLGNVRR
jgi:hypothetical protein